VQHIKTLIESKKPVFTEPRFRALIENSNDAIILRDENFAVIYCSPASERILGWTNEERCSELAADLVHPEDLLQMLELRQYVLDNPGIPVQMTYRIKHKNGHYLWSEGIMTNWLHDENVKAIVSNVRDVSARKNTEQQVADSEHRYRTLFQQNLAGVFQTTTEGNILNCNHAFATMLGYGSPGELIHTNASAFYYASATRDKFIFNLREQKKIYNYEVVLKKKDGSPVYVMENISLFTDPVTGEEICDGVLIDITEKKRAEEAAMIINNKIYEQQKVLLDLNCIKASLPFDDKLKMIIKEDAKTLAVERVSIWMYDATKTSLATEYIYSLAGDRFLPGMSLHEGDHPGHFNMLAGNSGITASDLLTGAIDPTLIHSYLQPLGITQIAYIPLRDGKNIIGFICHEHVGPKRVWLNTDTIFARSIADIISMAISREEGRLTEEALHRSEERYRQIVETAQEGIWLIDENNYTVFVNKKMCDMLEYTQEEMLGKQHYDCQDEKEREIMATQIERRKQGISETHDSAYITKNGKVFWANVSSNPILNEEGTYGGTLKMVTDISKRKEDEALLQQSEAKLAQKNEELELKNKEMEQFVYVASHDLQEPLRTISGFVKLLQQQYDEKLDDKAGKYFDFILQGADRMKILIRDLLDYSRIGKKDKLDAVDCNKVLANVISDLGAAINDSKAIIKSDELPCINGYPTEVKLLFQNLIMNAVKFRKKDTVPQINILVEKKNDHWQFSVKDNGIGIDKTQSERIFVIFQRLHSRTEYEGSGIGLAHCKKIVELHGGKIWIESEPGEGTLFHFTIPE
jgi:PAS domain S-box-containing protein